MAAPVVVAAAEAAVVRSSGPALCPSFAEVCSFMERYGAVLDLPDMTFPQMERYLRDTTAVPKPLVELHVKLLRKLGKSVTTDRWEKYLVKVCQDLNNTWAWELEQKGYQEMSMECKSSILKHLCECQFDDNLKFKSAINEEDPEKMRLQPVGKDRHGLMYWLQLDQEKNIRLYTEEQDDQDGSTWKCIVRNRNDLAEALDLLKGQLDPSQIKDQNPDQTGPGDTSPTQKDTGEDAVEGTKSEPSRTSEEHTDSKETEPANEEKPLIQVVKQEATDVEMKEEEEAEEKSDLKPPAFDNRVSTITTVIKSECRDSGDAPKKNAVSVVMAPVTKQEVNKEDDHAVRSSQQAKIPLKKRELKLAESYQSMNNLNHSSSTSNSSIIVCNPSVIQNKDSHNAREGKLSNSTAPPSETQTSQQQLVVTASRQELTNGKGLQKQAQNGVIGVIGQVGVIGHVGVIRRATEQAELNGPNSDPEKDVSRQSVLVRKGPVVEMETVVASATTTPKSALQSNAAKETETARKPTLISFKSGPKIPENREGKVDCVTVSALALSKTQEPKTKMAEDQEDKGKIADHQEKDINTEERTSSEACLGMSKDDNEKKPKCTLEKSEVEPESTVPPVDCNQDQKDQQKQTEGVNGGLAAPSTVKETGVGLEGKQGPLEEASSELQKEGIRLKIKIPPHRRRSKQRGKGKEEEREMEGEGDGDEDGRMLRRSSRICRSSALPNCRPSSKAADSPKKKTQKKQNDSTGTRGGEEEEEEEDDEQGLTAKKDRKTPPVGLMRKQRGKRRHRRPKWTNSKRRKLTEGGEGEEGGGKGGEEGSDGGSESGEESCKSEELPMEDACSHCGLPNHPELILLCDSCDNGYHTACLRPPLMLIPDGQWFCPPCQHKLLCEKLEEQLLNLDSDLKKKERAERRRERLVYVGISVENIIPEGDEEEEEEQKSAKKKDSKKSKNLGRRSTRTRKNISYRFDDFDDAIDEAIEEDVGDIGGGADCGKGIGADLSEEGRESRGPIRSQQLLSARRSRKRRRLNDLESDSTAAESEDEFMITNSSEEEEFAASGADEDDDDEDGGSEPGSLDRRGKASAKHKPGKTQRGKSKGGQSKRPKSQPGKAQRRGRKPLRRRRRRSSEEEEEDTEEDMNSDQISDMTDSEDEKKRRGLRRGQRQQVNYRETSVSSDNSRAEAKKVTPRPRGRPRKEHLSTDYSDASSRSSRDSEEEDEEGDQRRRDERRRRREEEKEGRHGHKRRRHDDRDDVTENDDDVTENDDDLRERGSSRKRLNNKDKTDKEEKRRRLKRTHRDKEEEEKEDMEKMGRGKRREILSEQRRKRLALMLKKRRPSTDEDDDDDESKESTSEEESESTSEEDRPVRKRLNRIDSDEDEEMEEEEEEGRLKSKKSSAVESDSTQNKGRDSSSLSPSNEQRTATRPESPTPAANSPKDRAGGDRHNGPKHSGEEKEEEEDNDDEDEDTLNSVQNSPES